MGRHAALTPEQVGMIRNSTARYVDLADTFGVSKLTIVKVRNFQGVYAAKAVKLGTPILDAHGQTIGVTPHNETVAEILPDAGE